MIEQQLKQYINLKKDLKKYFDSDEARQLIVEYFIKIKGWKNFLDTGITVNEFYTEFIHVNDYYEYGNYKDYYIPIEWFFSEEERNRIVEDKKEKDLEMKKRKLAEEEQEKNLYHLLKTKYGDV
jgi:hypothetical protein